MSHLQNRLLFILMFWGYDVFAKLDHISVGKWVKEAENSGIKMKRVEQKDSTRK